MNPVRLGSAFNYCRDCGKRIPSWEQVQQQQWDFPAAPVSYEDYVFTYFVVRQIDLAKFCPHCGNRLFTYCFHCHGSGQIGQSAAEEFTPAGTMFLPNHYEFCWCAQGWDGKKRPTTRQCFQCKGTGDGMRGFHRFDEKRCWNRF